MTRRVAAVTGAAQGLGAEIAIRLAADGFDVALLDIQADRLEKTSVDAEAAGARTLTLAADLTDEDAVIAAFARIDEGFGRLDALVNVAGGSGSDQVRSLADLSGDIWRKVLDNNLTSAFLCAREAVALMQRNGYGRIVNFSSAVANGKFGPSGTVGARLPYAASKAALNGFTKQLAKDLARTGITVNSVAPGLILPTVGRVRDIFEAQSPQARQATLDSLPAGRTGTGTEVAAAVSYLVSEDAGFTTGTILAVDGAEV
ncbi:SDR family oxidoreductase [Gordonia amarae]|uniref:SDR family oxidoreductase n=2 Tax=Gordonia amarae TaxID=36821 RepID=A0A857MG95_9ACTN|nr:SDR family NAD(P)-dependent oxidoreductase [Gordonia amarae]MCS3876526.1 3-oxoacyl-[acyl-carrier protein] reductase [Gordonia amarae]QHN19428.1 SDR family oxidoreductase [Gordonia amarae]QHN23904.1 SDR family oxidoreductase [Gordonia amarae]QHN32814.1 SDR family oxidoreductase [Gordonia amarae]QHN41533.1 SDR family oxidoreductase [Gordonia amarae]